ncbi:MAG: MoaD/ThiS family protein [Peptococcaceae bacterium]|nr:MoaD/ThiS family protein [Peptococcaceae bacterium]
MKVEVRVFCGLESCIPGARFGQPIPVEMPEGADGMALLKKLNIPVEKAFSFLINGVHKDFGTILAEGDRVSIFPPVGGG